MTEARKQVAAKAVRRELLENQSPELLKTLHLLTRDGQLNADARRKLKQVNHLVGLLQPAMDEALANSERPIVVDVGSGNAYLGFVLYELFFKAHATAEVVNIESREDLTIRARERAAALGFTRMKFEQAHVSRAAFPLKAQVLTALHACDTATDDALIAAVTHGVPHIAVVPCCQAEVAAQLKDSREEADLSIKALVSHPMHRREFGSHLTNVIRALVLESLGYQVTVTELTGWEHSLKNELILARKVGAPNRESRKRLGSLLKSTGVKPKLVRALESQLGLNPS